MTKIGILSDIHLEHRNPKFRVSVPLCCDFVIIAGDLHPDKDRREEFINEIEKQCPVVFIEGNHDFYYSNMKYSSKNYEFAGVKIFATTLWTPIRNQFEEYIFKSSISDARVIRNYDVLRMTEYWLKSVEEIRENVIKNECDIVVTHHAPSYRSIHPRFAHSNINFAFASNLDDMIENDFGGLKLWVHGHVHDPFDYNIGNTRIVCNPLGYPNENRIEGFKVIEI